MHPAFTQLLAAQHIAELRQEAAKQRLIRELRARQAPTTGHRRRVWERVPFRQKRPATA
jgi:hypothetical protein